MDDTKEERITRMESRRVTSLFPRRRNLNLARDCRRRIAPQSNCEKLRDHSLALSTQRLIVLSQLTPHPKNLDSQAPFAHSTP